MTCRLTLVDVFAARPLEGNLLAVVHDADGVGDAVMAVLARRFRLSETSFVQQPTREGADYRHRIFTIGREVPFAGHPSLGVAAAVCLNAGDRVADVVQETRAGLQPLSVAMDDDASGRVTLDQGDAALGEPTDATAVLAALGLRADDAHPGLPAQVVSTGLPALVVPLAAPAALDRALPRMARLKDALGEHGDPESLNCYVVAELEPGRWAARCFALDIAGGEDPATGSAAGPFGAFLQEHTGRTRVEIEQGVAMGSPSRMLVDTTVSVQITGDVHILGRGTIELPRGH